MQVFLCYLSRHRRGNIHTLCQADGVREALEEMGGLQTRRLQRALRGVREDQPSQTRFMGDVNDILCSVLFGFCVSRPSYSCSSLQIGHYYSKKVVVGSGMHYLPRAVTWNNG